MISPKSLLKIVIKYIIAIVIFIAILFIVSKLETCGALSTTLANQLGCGVGTIWGMIVGAMVFFDIIFKNWR